MNKTNWILIIAVAVLVALNLKQCQNTQTAKNESENIIHFLNDTIVSVENKLGEQSKKARTLELSSEKALLAIQSKDKEVQRLQKVVKKYKKEIRGGGSVTVIKDSIAIKDSIVGTVDSSGTTTFLITEPNNWYYGSLKVNKTLGEIQIGFRNEYTVIIEYERKGLLKKVPYTLVTNLNPYSDIQNIKSFKTTIPKRRISLSIQGGYGITKDGLSPYIGIGLGYSLIRF